MNRPRARPRRRTRAAALAAGTTGALLLAPGAWRHVHAPAAIARAAGLTTPAGLRWLTPRGWSPEPPGPHARAVLLVHGLDEPGPIWDRLAPALLAEGHAVVRFDYPNDQPAAASAGLLRDALADLHAQGVGELAIVAHSMGGLLARDALTRPGPGAVPPTPVLITLGTPFAGSPFTGFQPLAEAREHAQRYLASDDRDPARLLAGLHDGRGEARHDLAPDSAYLTELMARPWPPRTPPGAAPIRLVCIAAVIAGDPADPGPFAARLGDGVVPLDSAIAPDADEALRVQANHRSMVRPIEAADWLRAALGLPPGPAPPAVPLVLERVGAEGTRH